MNPLSGYFRQPGIFVKLPSKGKFTKPEDLELSMTGELGVYPMSAKDEIWAKNPDGLLNGQSIEEIIKSCVPGVKNPRKLPNQDIDYLLIAIKKVTYGDVMRISATCPKCGEPTEADIDLDYMLTSITPLEDEYAVRLNEVLVAKLKPFDFESSTKTNLAAFEESKLFQTISNIEISQEQRISIFSNSFKRISNLHLEIMSECVECIVTPDGIITNKQHIKEFLENAPKDYVNKIKEELEKFKSTGMTKEIHVCCQNKACNHEWETDLIMDPSHFFE
jgi:hypothetical protein